MGFADGHCDVISKLLVGDGADFVTGNRMDASLPMLKKGGVRLQFFAIFIPERYRPFDFGHVLKSVAQYIEHVLSQPEMISVRQRFDLARLVPGERIGALLTLEGVDAVPDDPDAWRILYELGVRSVGLTWNYANWAADGIMEPRGGGLTRSGKRLVASLNRYRMLIDVSHLSERGFWDVAESSERPFIASHSNVYDICPHPRNLKGNQIDRLIAGGGMIGLTFVPWFLVPEGDRRATAASLLRHLDAILARGGRFSVGFGSDFDGFDDPLPGLEHPGKFGTLRELLLKHYTEEETEDFAERNWVRFLFRELPE